MINIKRKHYSMMSADGNAADIFMYGEIVESRPIDWWTGDEIEGSFIVKDEFLNDLNSLSTCKNITLHIDSLGGDSYVSVFIHNKLRELSANGTSLTCIIDGCAMSGASHIMCACDTVKANPSSLIMIHKCWTELWGGYNADEMRKMAEELDAVDRQQIEIYKRKCSGLSDAKIAHMMSETTYLTGREAKELGFVDELIEDVPLDIAASADGKRIRVKGHTMYLMPGVFAPDNIPTLSEETDSANEITAEVMNSDVIEESPEAIQEEGEENMTTPEELKEKNPELYEAVRAGITATVRADAIKAERERLCAIDKVAHLFSSEMVKEARYGETACTAEELTYRAALSQAETGKAFIGAMKADNDTSGVNDVPAATAPEEKPEEEKSEEDRMKEASAIIGALLKK